MVVQVQEQPAGHRVGCGLCSGARLPRRRSPSAGVPVTRTRAFSCSCRTLTMPKDSVLKPYLLRMRPSKPLHGKGRGGWGAEVPCGGGAAAAA